MKEPTFRSRPDPTRREFLQGSLVAGLGLTHPFAPSSPPWVRTETDRSVILILNVGGLSHVDMWDPKPDVPAEIRGPWRTIRTTVPGIFLSELCPRQACLAHRLAFIRSCHHTAPAVHHVGWQLAQTGHAYPAAMHASHIGSVVANLLGARRGRPAHVLLPGIPGDCEVVRRAGRVPTQGRDDVDMVPNCQALLAREPQRARARYGSSPFGQNCLAARCLVGAGVRFVTIHTCEDYRDPDSWDVHGGPNFPTVVDMKRTLAPAYDQAFSALIEDLAVRGMLDQTLVCCVSEFGRTPRMNPAGGRDHWPQCWTTSFAGGGVLGGQVIGASDGMGSEPAERPVSPAEIAGTIYHYLGLDPVPTPSVVAGQNRSAFAPEMRPIGELF